MVAATSARLTLLSRRWLIETFEEAPKARGKFPPHHFAALPQLFGDVSGDIARPAFSGVEADDPDRICILAAQQVANDGLVIRHFRIGLAKQLGSSRRGLQVGPALMPPGPAVRDRAVDAGAVFVRRSA